MTAPLVGIVMGSDSDWEVMQHAARPPERVRRAARMPGRERPPHARPAVPLRRGGAGSRPPMHHRGRGRRGAPPRHARRQDHRCRCSACRSPRPTCKASIRSSRSCRCRPACRWPPSPSAPRAPHNAGLYAVAILAVTDAALAQRLEAFRAAQTRARARAQAARGRRDPARRHVGVRRRRPAGPDVHPAGAVHGLSGGRARPRSAQPGGDRGRPPPPRRLHRRARRSTSWPRRCAGGDDRVRERPRRHARAAGARRTIVRPPVGAVAIAQDRIAEKTFLQDAGFATAPFRPVRSAAELREARVGGPAPRAAQDQPAGLRRQRPGGR